MSDDRDVAAFGARAGSYDAGWLGRFHHDVARRVASVAASASSHPRRVLDVGCGSGYLLSLLAEHYSCADALIGVDPSMGMVDVAQTTTTDDVRIEVLQASAEQLPFRDGEFDLIVATTSFDHWRDQPAGLRECARVVNHDGVVIVADLFAPVLLTTLVGKRRHKARTRPRAQRLLSDAGLRVTEWHKIQTLIQACVACPT